MHVFYDADPNKQHQVDAMRALNLGLMRHNIKPTAMHERADLFVTWGQAKMYQRAKPCLILEAGYINGTCGTYQQRRLTNISVSWNEPHGSSHWTPENRDSGRFEQLNVRLMPWRQPVDSPRILFCAQHPNDKAAPPTSRVLRAVQKLRDDHEYVTLRRHPLCDPDQEPLSIALAKHDIAVTFASTAAVEAVFAGLPVVCLDSRCIAAPVASESTNDLWFGDRTSWAYNLAHRQFTLSEFADGIAWELIKDGFDHCNRAISRAS